MFLSIAILPEPRSGELTRLKSTGFGAFVVDQRCRLSIGFLECALGDCIMVAFSVRILQIEFGNVSWHRFGIKAARALDWQMKIVRFQSVVTNAGRIMTFATKSIAVLGPNC